jgi:hypothetical protein
MFGIPWEPTPEQIQQAEDAQARGEAEVAALRRMLAEELTMEQLEHLHQLFYMITNSGKAAFIAEWWEGVIWGVKAAREIRLGEITETELAKLDGE